MASETGLEDVEENKKPLINKVIEAIRRNCGTDFRRTEGVDLTFSMQGRVINLRINPDTVSQYIRTGEADDVPANEYAGLLAIGAEDLTKYGFTSREELVDYLNDKGDEIFAEAKAGGAIIEKKGTVKARKMTREEVQKATTIREKRQSLINGIISGLDQVAVESNKADFSWWTLSDELRGGTELQFSATDAGKIALSVDGEEAVEVGDLPADFRAYGFADKQALLDYLNAESDTIVAIKANRDRKVAEEEARSVDAESSKPAPKSTVAPKSSSAEERALERQADDDDAERVANHIYMGRQIEGEERDYDRGELEQEIARLLRGDTIDRRSVRFQVDKDGSVSAIDKNKKRVIVLSPREDLSKYKFKNPAEAAKYLNSKKSDILKGIDVEKNRQNLLNNVIGNLRAAKMEGQDINALNFQYDAANNTVNVEVDAKLWSTSFDGTKGNVVTIGGEYSKYGFGSSEEMIKYLNDNAQVILARLTKEQSVATATIEASPLPKPTVEPRPAPAEERAGAKGPEPVIEKRSETEILRERTGLIQALVKKIRSHNSASTIDWDSPFEAGSVGLEINNSNFGWDSIIAPIKGDKLEINGKGYTTTDLGVSSLGELADYLNTGKIGDESIITYMKKQLGVE